MTIDYIVDDLMDNLDHGSAKTNPKLKRQIVESYIRLAHQEGRTTALAEMNHETRKFLDGFGHPKDCEECKPPATTWGETHYVPDLVRPINHERP